MFITVYNTEKFDPEYHHFEIEIQGFLKTITCLGACGSENVKSEVKKIDLRTGSILLTFPSPAIIEACNIFLHGFFDPLQRNLFDSPKLELSEEILQLYPPQLCNVDELVLDIQELAYDSKSGSIVFES